MTSNAPSQRDTRIDVFRALALLTIFVNHVPGTIFEHFTHKNFGFSDSAEAFVLISGIAVGLAYGLKFEPGNRLLITLKAWRRAGVLYTTHIMTTVATLGIFSAAALYFSRPDLLKLINIELIINDTPEALVGIATLSHQVGYNNILSMYAVVLLMMPAFLLIGAVSLRLMVLASGLLWLIAGIYQIAPANYPGDGFWFLNPLSWQFLFVIGIAGMMHVKRGGEIRFNWWMASAAVFYLAGALFWVKWPLWGIETASGLPTVLTGFDKTFLSASRLLHILSIAYLIVTIPVLSNLARTGPDHPLAVLGKHSLPVFIAGTILAMVAQVMKTVSPGGLFYDSILMSAGIALQFALAYYLDWLPKIGWGGKKPKPAAVSRTTAGGALKPAS
ncbi:OpgC family protein [Mesorhizobium sp. ZC-5]|uniref:OpgC family protein n=1 Tax=Mesorhizobium sp. ZC-5 TaxID=2986066 RepID=UPI0021E8D84F|nr:OpgC domain-containing protein [Mesorhizobium sp. ZC-5]MCV3238758.1 OpgC domain-containing protein [Mesorhizobium sp. ZC-5]